MSVPFDVRDADNPGVVLFSIDRDGKIQVLGTIVPAATFQGGLTLQASSVGFDSTLTLVESAATSSALLAKVTGDTVARLAVRADGQELWGPGNGAADTNLYRNGAAQLATDSDLLIRTAGKGLQVAEGANAKMGTATLSGGTVVVSTTAVTANSRVYLTAQTSGAAPGALRVSARTAGTSFTITSTSGTDTSSVAWLIVEPSA